MDRLLRERLSRSILSRRLEQRSSGDPRRQLQKPMHSRALPFNILGSARSGLAGSEPLDGGIFK